MPRQVDALNNSYKDIPLEFKINPIDTRGISKGIQRYQANPKSIQALDRAYVWDRRQQVLEDLQSIHKGSSTRWQPTFKEPEELEQNPLESKQTSANLCNQDFLDFEDNFLDNLKNNQQKYGNRQQYYSNPLNNRLKDSLATLLLKKEEHIIIDVNHLPKTHTKFTIDSIAVQIALREKEIAEFYTYFTLITLLKRINQFPVTNVSTSLELFTTFLSTYRKKQAKQLLLSCAKAGFIKIDGNPRTTTSLNNQTIEILSQQDYARKHEKAYNARAHNSFNQYGLGISKVARKRGVNAWVTFRDKPKYHNKVLPIVENQELYGTFRPYFTYYTYKSTEIDTGFIHLINARHHQMIAYLYYLVLTAFNFPICRTMIATNLCISKASQLRYEKTIDKLEKRFNHTEITEDLLNSMDSKARDTILSISISGGKFKRSRSGKIYRQEPNSYRSNLVWTHSDKTAHLRLSHKRIMLWRAVEPVFKDGLSSPTFQEVPRSLLFKEEKLKTLIKKKKDLSTRYFALNYLGVIIPTTNRKNWVEFEPLATYDRATGDKHLPNQKSLYDIDFRISRVERDLKLESTNAI